MRNRARVLIVIAAVLLPIGAAWFLSRTLSPRVIARAVAPDGTEMCILQRFNWSAEPFTTKFFFRKPGSSWGAFYFDHQDDYWSDSRVVINPVTSVAVFYRGNSPAVTFDPATETYTLHRRNQTTVGAQWQMPAGWSPEAE